MCRFRRTVLVSVGALFTFPMVIPSRVKAFGPVLHFSWNPLEHALLLTGTVLECKAAEHLAHFSFKLLASARDKP